MTARYVSRAELESIKAAKAGEAQAVEAAEAQRRAAMLGRATRQNLHNLGQLEAAGFPAALNIEVVYNTHSTTFARICQFLGKDVEFDVREGHRHDIVRKLLKGYVMRPTYGTVTPWDGSPAFSVQRRRDVAVDTEGGVYSLYQNNMSRRGALTVKSHEYSEPLGSLRNPIKLPSEISFHFNELTAHALTEAGVEFVPYRED
ncbi:MAG TPA: hypothetical protein VFX86_04560 [Candidatus Saccharimonadales bacterium]|nr:hypothetical protein [Candidatus Saccharimonadales bacterium]